MPQPNRFGISENLATTQSNVELKSCDPINSEVQSNCRQKSTGNSRLQLAWSFFLNAVHSKDIRQQYDKFSEQYFDLFGHSQLLYAQLLVDFVANLVQHDQNRILDLGAGSGILSFPLAKHSKSTISVDFSHNMLRKGFDSTLKNEAIFWQQADVYELPYKSNSFDIVISCGLITHILPSRFEIFVNEMCRVVNQNGHVIFNVPPHPWRRILLRNCPLEPSLLDYLVAAFYNRFHNNLGMSESRCGLTREMIRREFLKHGMRTEFHTKGDVSLVHATKN